MVNITLTRCLVIFLNLVIFSSNIYIYIYLFYRKHKTFFNQLSLDLYLAGNTKIYERCTDIKRYDNSTEFVLALVFSLPIFSHSVRQTTNCTLWS